VHQARLTLDGPPIPLAQMVRLAAVVFVLTLALVALPLLVRAYFDVYSMQLVLAALLWLGLTVAGALVTLVLSFHALLRRRVALRTAIGVSIGLTLLASIAVYFVTVMIQLRVPSWSALDSSEPQTLLYGISSSLADAIPLTAAWTGLFFFPAVLRAHAERIDLVIKLKPQFFGACARATGQGSFSFSGGGASGGRHPSGGLARTQGL
jgi:uncharacterized membrane protein YgcG